MKFTVKYEVHIDEYVLTNAIASIIVYNRICTMLGKPFKKINRTNIMAEIKTRLDVYGRAGLQDGWSTTNGIDATYDADEYLEQFRHLIEE